MDLGIAGKTAIVCASSRGLGYGCAMALAEAGCEVIVNGRDEKRLNEAAAEIAKATKAKIIPVVADVATPAGQKALFAACPEPDILVNNNAGPPFRDFRELDRQKILDSVVNITSSSVKAPIAGLDLSSGARAGLTSFLAGVARTVAGSNVTINFLLPGSFDTDRLRSNLEMNAKKQNVGVDQIRQARMNTVPAKRFGQPDEFGAACAFLCSARAGYITGQNLLIDGGAFASAF